MKQLSLEVLSRAESWLSSANLRPTRQRLVLAAVLIGDGHDWHVTAESLHAAARRKELSVSLATIYNTLRVFCEAGLLKEIIADGHRSWFDTRVDDHPHFYWEDSGVLTDAPKEQLRIVNLPRPPEGMVIADVDVVIRIRRK